MIATYVERHHMYLSFPRTPIQIVARDKLSGLGQHVGVLFPNGQVAHLTDERGVEVISLAEFAQGRAVRTVRRVPPGAEHAIRTRLDHALRRQPPYAPLNFNCETFATWLVGEKPHSVQVTGLFLLAGFLTAASLAR